MADDNMEHSAMKLQRVSAQGDESLAVFVYLVYALFRG